MTTISCDEMSEQLFAALPELRPIADQTFSVEGLDVVEESPYSVFGSVLAPYLDALLDADASPDRDRALARVFAFLESFIGDPQWTSGGYNYADNVVALEILEHLMSQGAEERLRRARPLFGPLVAESLAEMEAWWEQERQRQSEAAAPENAMGARRNASTALANRKRSRRGKPSSSRPLR